MEIAKLRPVAESFFRSLVGEDGAQGPYGTGTAVVAAACVAGAQLLRGTGLPLADLTPGSTVLGDVVDERGQALLGEIGRFLNALEGEPINMYRFPPLIGTGPAETLFELTEQCEGPFVADCDASGIAPADRPQVAALAIALLVHRASPVLDPATARSVVIQAMVPACKTVPPPLTPGSDGSAV